MSLHCKSIVALAVVFAWLRAGFAADTPSRDTLAKAMEPVDDAELCVYKLRDTEGRGMDCLELFQPAGEGYKGGYRVHHTRRDGVFSVHLAHSMDLKEWTHVKEFAFSRIFIGAAVLPQGLRMKN